MRNRPGVDWTNTYVCTSITEPRGRSNGGMNELNQHLNNGQPAAGFCCWGGIKGSRSQPVSTFGRLGCPHLDQADTTASDAMVFFFFVCACVRAERPMDDGASHSRDRISQQTVPCWDSCN